MKRTNGLVFNKEYKIFNNTKYLLKNGQSMIKEYIFDNYYYRFKQQLDMPILSSSFIFPSNWCWHNNIETSDTQFRGKLSKRIKKYIKQKYNINLTTKDMGKIGSIIDNYSLLENFIIIFTDYFNWNPGDYNDYNSCFWTYNSPARKLMKKHGVYAALLHDKNGKGIGRTWIYDYDSETSIIFNAYGVTLEKIANVLLETSLFSNPVNFIKLTNEGTSKGLIYINYGGIIIGPSATKIKKFDLKIDTSKYIKCEYCGNYVDKNEYYDMHEDGECSLDNIDDIDLEFE